MQRNLLAIAASSLEVKHPELDANPYLLNLENGTLDLRTGKLKPHHPDDLLTKVAPVRFDAAATCPLFLAFLGRVLNQDQQLIRFIQKALGYSLTGAVTEQVFFLCYGTGANGKSTLMELVSIALGDYALAAPPGLLLAKKHDGHPTDIADLFGARFVQTSEVKTDAKFDEQRIKSFTGGDTLKARRMREDFWSFTPTHKIWVSTNHKPEVRDSSHGFWRRVRMIPFTVTIPESEKDPHLLGKLCAELPGILNWMIAGCLTWQAEGLGTCAAVERATADYRAESDSMADFIDERCECGAPYEVQSTVLYQAYVAWAEARKERPESIKGFGERIRELGYRPRKANTVFYVGLRIKPDASSLIDDLLMGRGR
jgi:putative DNA primase/helicase